MNLEKVLKHLGFLPEDYSIDGSDFLMTSNHVKPSETQLQKAWEEVQLKEYDIATLINEYIKDREIDLENDCFNIVDGVLHSFSYTHITKPTNAHLLELKSIVEAKLIQDKINQEAEEYLKSTDFYVIRMMDSGLPMPEGMQLLRQQARDRIVRS